MDVFAAVMTGPGAAAIATIQVYGQSAGTILSKVFKPVGGQPANFETSRIFLGHITDGPNTIDQVTIGCEAPQQFAIHCHGNPIIVQAIMALLHDHGVQLCTAEQLRARMLSAGEPQSAIASEANLALATVRTLQGARIITSQVNAGLSHLATQWQQQIESMSLDNLAAQARQVLEDSKPARLIISGCSIVLIGPPNTGKSTLLNALAGREKAIVTDIKGTTRDWISAEIHIPPLAATIIDTAGLDLTAVHTDVAQAAQARTLEMLHRADLILLVLDITEPATQLTDDLLAKLTGKEVLPVLNKTDLLPNLDPTQLPAHLGRPIPISATQPAGLEDLIGAIHRQLHVTNFNPQTPIALTTRQQDILHRLATATSHTAATPLISELLEGPLSL